jgi:hypothetical protein
MQSFNYRSVKALSDHRYRKIARNRLNPGRPGSNRIWHDEIWQDQIPVRREKRINNRAPDRSRAA